jgi:hypothetical protein
MFYKTKNLEVTIQPGPHNKNKGQPQGIAPTGTHTFSIKTVGVTLVVTLYCEKAYFNFSFPVQHRKVVFSVELASAYLLSAYLQ